MKDRWINGRWLQNRAVRSGAAILCGLLLLLLASPRLAWANGPTFVPGGSISTDTTWTAFGSPYIVQGNVTVANGATLTIEPGAEVKFTGSLWLSISSGGGLMAEGTAGQPILFTSNAAEPAPGDWRYIYFAANATGRLSHCEISYAGAGNYAALEIRSSDVEVRNCRIHRSQDEGVEILGAGLSPTLADSRIENNGGRAIQQNTVDMTPTYQNLTLTGNGTDAVVIPGGTLGRHVTLDSPGGLNGRPFILTGNTTVAAGQALTVTAGSEVRFNDALWLSVSGDGRLHAQGTAAYPITFTTNFTTPVAGDWRYILFAANATGRLSHCEISYAGAGNYAALEIRSSDVEVRNCRIHRSQDEGVEILGAGLSPTLADSRIENNGGVAIQQSTVDMTPTYQNLTLTDNGTDAVVIPGGTLGRHVTLDGPGGLKGSPFILTSVTTVAADQTLTIAPGSEVRFNNALWLSISSGGRLMAEGTAGQPILFTSNAAEPAPGAWRYIYFAANATGRLSHCEISYAGAGSYAALEIRSSDVEVRNCRIHRSQDEAIEVRSAQPVIRDNLILNNEFGLRNATPATEVDATFNYWGHPSGPNHPALNPEGQGNGVSNGVLINPWYFSDGLDKNDLMVTVVSTPANSVPGDDITVSYTVQNGNNTALTQTWIDSVYLSSDPFYDPSDLLLTRVEHTSGVAANSSYNKSVTAPLPGLTTGDYYVIVVADSRRVIPDPNPANNRRASAETFNIAIPTLAIGDSATGNVAQTRQRYYKLDIPAGSDLLLRAQFNPSGAVYLRYNGIPTASEYDFASNDFAAATHEILLTDAAGGEWYVLLTGDATFTLSAEVVAFRLQDAAPLTGGNVGPVTVNLTGIGFTPETVVNLSLGTTNISANVELISPYRLVATFDLAGAPLGDYTFTTSKPGFSATAGEPFVVVPGRPAELRANLALPWGVRPNLPFSAQVRYENVGDVDMPASILIVKAPEGGNVFPAGYTIEEASASMQFLALPPGTRGGVLPPHTQGRFAFSASIALTGSTVFSLTRRITPMDAALDYAALRQSIQPSEENAAWNAAWNAIVAGRTTYGDLLDLLVGAAYRSDDLGLSIRSLRALLHFAVQEELHKRPADLRGTLFVDQGGKLTPVKKGMITLTDDQFNSVAGSIWHDGSFAVRGLQPGSYRVSVNGYAYPSVATLAYSGSAQSSLEIIVQPAGIIRGIVRSGDRWFETAGDALVRLLDDDNNLIDSAQSDQWGRFSLASVPLNKPFTITASHPDFANALPRPITLTQPEMRNQLVYLRKGGQISGLVMNSSGQPIPNLTIRGRADNVEARSTVSDENGRYILGNLANGRYSLEASHNNASTVVDNVLILGDYSVREVDLTLTHQRQLVVTVQNPNGTPVPGVLVDLEYSLAPLARTNDAGKVNFTGLPESELFMLVEAGANHQARIISINESAESRLVTVHPFGSVGGVVGGVSGVLRRANGGPAAGIVVTLQGTLFPAESLETDASGSYQFTNLPDGDYTLSIGNGFNDAIQRSFTIDAENLSPTLDITISYTEIPIRLVDREGVPVVEGLIYLMLNGVNTAFGETDSAGRVTLRAFETGSYSLFATAQEEGWQRRSLHVLLNQTFSEQLLILDDASVSITVTGNGQPVADALIALIDGADGSLHVTDGAGVVTIKSLPAGNYTLVISAEGYAAQDGNFSHGATAGVVPVNLSATRSDQPMVQASFLPEPVMAPTVMALSAGAVDASLRKGRTSSSRPVRNGFQSSFRLPPLPANATEACKEARRALIKADNLAEQAFLNWEQSHWTKKELKNIDSAIVLVQGTKVAADVASLLRAGPTNAAQAQLKQLQSTQSGLVKANEVLGHLSNLNDLRSSLSDLVNGGGTKDAVFTTLNIMKAEAAAISSILSSDPAMAAKFGAAGQVISTVQDIVDLVDNVQIGLNNAKILNDQISESENQYRQAVDNLSKVSTEWELMNLGGDASDCVNGGSEPEDPPEDEQDPTDQDETERRVSMDPNDILGPRGYGPERWIPNDTLMLYTIRYENVVTATAPAQLVTIEHAVSEYLDYSTFAFDEFGFGDYVFPVPAGRQFFQSRLDLVSELGYIIEYTARFDRATGVARWQLAALDPETGDLSSDPEAGFLPPNANSPEGEGYVRFFIRPRAGLATSTQIDAQARIVFDTNEHIDTPVYRNTIDSSPPASAVQSLPAISPPQVIVHWGGDDGGGSGIAFYDIYRSTNGGLWERWLRTSDISASFSGELDSVYAFYSVATDNVGYREAKLPAAETSTTITVQSDRYLYLPLISRGEYPHLYLPLISQGQ